MTQEEKAKAYDEAIERAKDFKEGVIHYELKIGENIMDYIFPELKESEDEKIRKELIEEIKEMRSSFIGAPDCRDKYEEEELEKYNRWIAWLEKQGEQKVIFPKFRVGDVIRHIPNEVNMSQVEYRITRIDDKFYYSELEDGTEVLLFGFPVEDDFELVEQKNGWSEEDEDTIEKAICVLKANFEPNAEFSGLDIKRYQLVERLKSLHPQKHWKPSEEQMKTLLSEVTAWTKGCPKQIVLESLYNDLKKLKS